MIGQKASWRVNSVKGFVLVKLTKSEKAVSGA
jgi:hypothetical protein